MSSIPAQLPLSIRSYLGRFAWRRCAQAVVHALGRAIAFSSIWIVLACVIDRLLGLPTIARAALLAANITIVIAILAPALAAMLRTSDPRRLAREVESREPAFAERLETVTSRLLGPDHFRGSDALLNALTTEVANETSHRKPGRLLPWRPALRPFAIGLILLAAAFGLSKIDWLDLPTLLRRYATPAAPINAVTTTRLIVSPGDTSIPEGDTLRIRVTATRLGDLPPVLHARAAGQEWTTQVMSAGAGDTFEARLRDVDRTIEYFITGGDARSPQFVASLLPKPAITGFRVRYVYPPYTGLPPREVRSSDGDVEAPAGTEVTFTIESTEPLSLAVMTIGGEGVRMTPAGPNAHVATFVVRDDKRYAIRMASSRGVNGSFRGGSIRAIPDRPPIVRLRGSKSLEAPATGFAPIPFSAVDDYGLARLDAELFIARQVGGTERRSLPVSINRTRQESATFNLDLSQLGVHPGDVIELRLRAEDRAGQFDLTEAVKIAVTSDVATPRPASNPPTTAHADDSIPLDPPGFGQALRAYFEALRH